MNPFDRRCTAWDLWQEAPFMDDLENMAESLIPIQGDGDPFWCNAARSVFVSAAHKMREDKDRSIEKLLNLLITSELTELEHYLIGTPAAAIINAKIEKTAVSVRTYPPNYSICRF